MNSSFFSGLAISIEKARDRLLGEVEVEKKARDVAHKQLLSDEIYWLNGRIHGLHSGINELNALLASAKQWIPN